MKKKAAECQSGQRFEVRYPFARDTWQEMTSDEDGVGYTDVPTWKPGIRHTDVGDGNIESLADGFGVMVLTVVSLHKPGRFPSRLFFTRSWVTPDGKAFGKHKLRITTLGAFRTLTRRADDEYFRSGTRYPGQ